MLGLVVDRAPRWAIRRLTETYLTLSLFEIGRAVGMENIEEIRRVVQSMVSRQQIGDLPLVGVLMNVRLDRGRRD